MPLVGFVGLGLMGEPMALNLARAGTPLVVWNRSAEKCHPLAAAGARVAESAADVCAQADVIIVMLADAAAIDAVLARHTHAFPGLVGGRTIVHMGTTDPDYSRDLEADIVSVGGNYVEAPVSGSRVPAQDADLVAMVAGRPGVPETVVDLLRPMCREVFMCGPVPNALLTKLAVNLFLITMVTGLAESMHFAERQGLDLERLRAVLDAGPMASSVSRVKGAKLVAGDFTAQAAIADVFQNARLVASAARANRSTTPLLSAAHDLYGEALALGHGTEDMVAVVRALEARSSTPVAAPPCAIPVQQ